MKSAGKKERVANGLAFMMIIDITMVVFKWMSEWTRPYMKQIVSNRRVSKIVFKS